MDAIFSSKIFKSSSRKESIKAEYENPVNKPLVLQLKKYLGEEYQTEEFLEPDNMTENIDRLDKSDEANSKGGGSSSSGGYSGGGSGGMSLADKFNSLGSDLDFDDGSEDESFEDSSEESFDEPESSTVEESTSIESATVLNPYDSSRLHTLSTESILGLLNSDSSTSGVSRVSIKEHESELWIYYNDKINLNNVMESVISRLDSSTYSQLEFNRLARSDNAVVFEYMQEDSSVEEEDDDAE